MKSLFAKILLWFWATLAVTVIGSGMITALSLSSTDRHPMMSRLVDFQLREARHAYEAGGRAALAEFSQRFHGVFEGHGILTNEDGQDLLTGQYHPRLMEHARQRQYFRSVFEGRTLVMNYAHDEPYWFFFLVPRIPAGTWVLMPQHLWIIGAAVLFCFLLAYHLTRPLRTLEKAMAAFGQGDFSARANSTRRDELGQLARTFDQMAERIETLMAAERRLLLDISHELRSPLARLGVAVELARSGEDQDAALNRIQKESDRLNALVGQLLEVTRAEGDPSALEHTRVPMDELLAELVDDCSIEAAARGSLLVLKAVEPFTVEGDPELLRRAAENIIRNAIRYAPPATAVEVSVERANGTGVIAVRDYGPGVPEESLARIFDPFYRVASDRNRLSGGVGLGLSIARRAVDLHKGKLAARNAHPGLIMRMELPVADRPAMKTRVPATEVV